MIRLVIRSIGTTEDVRSLPLGGFAPDNENHFAVLIDVSIGPHNGSGAELFRFSDCSPSWMENEVVTGGAHWLRHYLLLERWNYQILAAAITKLCTSIAEPTWHDVAINLGRYMRWEFEDRE